MLRVIAIWLMLSTTAVAADLTYVERDNRIYLHTEQGELYGSINLSTGAMLINGPRLMVRGYPEENAQGDEIPLYPAGIRSIIVETWPR